jgi:hypothetical protein
MAPDDYQLLLPIGSQSQKQQVMAVLCLSCLASTTGTNDQLGQIANEHIGAGGHTRPTRRNLL